MYAAIQEPRPHLVRAVQQSVVEELRGNPLGLRSLSALRNDLRAAERDWQDFVRFDVWPGGNPYSDLRDEALVRHGKLKAEIARRERAA